MIFKFCKTFFLLTLTFATCEAKISLSGLFSNHMVLQRESQVAMWGKAKANTNVALTTSWNKITYKILSDANGNWKVQVATSAAGGPYQIIIDDGQPFILSDILLGEVWVCSGQSNMEMPLRGNSSPILNASEIILNADNENLRLYRVSREASLTKIDGSKGFWMKSNPENARDFSALAFQYGKIIQERLKVPVGIILSTVGGTMIQSWMSAESLKAFPEVKIPVILDTVKSAHRLPTTLYNGMIAPIVGYGIKGFIWMQGESNRHEPQLYGHLFPAMVNQWRNDWGLGVLPFYYVQIAPFGSTDQKRSGPKLRESQLNALKLIPNAGMVSAMDVGMEMDIHFMDKTTLAQRLSYWALGKTYGIKGIEYQSPMFKLMEVKDHQAIITFENTAYLTSYKKEVVQFEVAGADQIFHRAKAQILANRITVSSDKVGRPVAVRYAFTEWAVAEIFSNNGLPASSFRTDDW